MNVLLILILTRLVDGAKRDNFVPLDSCAKPLGRAEFVRQAVNRALDAYERAEKIKADLEKRKR